MVYIFSLLIASWLWRWHQLNRSGLNGTCCIVNLCVHVSFACPLACDYINIGLWVFELLNWIIIIIIIMVAAASIVRLRFLMWHCFLNWRRSLTPNPQPGQPEVTFLLVLLFDLRALGNLARGPRPPQQDSPGEQGTQTSYNVDSSMLHLLGEWERVIAGQWRSC
jgi:hypothetical protein